MTRTELRSRIAAASRNAANPADILILLDDMLTLIEQRIPVMTVEPLERSDAEPMAWDEMSTFKLTLAEKFKSPRGVSWPYDEEQLLLGVMQRPNWRNEWVEIVALRQAGAQFPESIRAVLSGWVSLVERSRNARDRSGKFMVRKAPVSELEREQQRAEEYLKSIEP